MTLRNFVRAFSNRILIKEMITEQAERDEQILYVMAVSNLSQHKVIELSKTHKVNLRTLCRMFMSGWTPENGWPKSVHIKDIINCLVD